MYTHIFTSWLKPVLEHLLVFVREAGALASKFWIHNLYCLNFRLPFKRHRTNFRQRTEKFDRTLFSLLFSTFLSGFYNCPCAEQYFSKYKMVFTPRPSIFEHTGLKCDLDYWRSNCGVANSWALLSRKFTTQGDDSRWRLKVTTQIRQHFNFSSFLLLMVDLSPPQRYLCVVGKLGREKEPRQRREADGRLVAWIRPKLNHLNT